MIQYYNSFFDILTVNKSEISKTGRARLNRPNHPKHRFKTTFTNLSTKRTCREVIKIKEKNEKNYINQEKESLKKKHENTLSIKL